PVAMSLFASFISAVAILGITAEMYTYGTQFWLISFGFVALIPMTAHVYLPVFYNLKLSSIHEYLELRFNKPCRLIASACFIIQTVRKKRLI
ncbi:hypothetical protein CAPTEDRAFT_94045, partial [Capitella teleta]